MLSVIAAFGTHTFASLKVRNYRLYFIGQALSQCGNWMQTVALGWLVLQLTGSGVQLGTVLAFQYFPMLVGGPFGGIFADHFDRRRILYCTQTLLGLLAFAISALVYFDAVQMWMLYGLSFCIGIANAVDQPTRQIFVHEMVGRDLLRNAVTLNSTEANLARAVGPLIAGILIAGIGIAFCFFINALSFIAVLVILTLLDKQHFYREKQGQNAPNELLSVFPYVASVPIIRDILITMGLIGTLTYEFHVSLPLIASQAFSGTAADYAALLTAMGIGSVLGGLYIASRQHVSAREFANAAFFFGISMLITAAMPTLSLATLGMFFVGFFSINLTSVGNTIIQLECAPHIRGRVMSLWATALFGSTLIGAPIIGFIGEHGDARLTLAVGGIAALIGGMYASRKLLKGQQFFSMPEFFTIRTQETASESTKL